MKHRSFRRVLSALLALLLFAAAPISPLRAAAADAEEIYPIIYIIGRTTIYNHLSEPDKRVSVPDAPDDEITDAVKEALPYAAKAVLLGQWDEYCDKAYDLIMQFFEGYGLDENGNVCNDSGVTYSWSEDRLSRDYNSNDPYTYRFEYDCRLSPLEIADDLNDYIEAVKRVTGTDKVSIISRCLGTNIAFAYLYKYQKALDYSGINALVLYDNSTMGIEMLEAAFSGAVQIDPDAASKFLDGFDLDLGDETLSEFVSLTLRMLEETYGIDITADLLERFYEKIKEPLFRRFLKSTFASTPGYWSMVNEHYQEAKAYIFGEQGDLQTYAGLISKLDAFRTVQMAVPQTIRRLQAAGVDVYAICKYGFLGYPVSEDVKLISDGVTGVKKQSFGATVSDYDATLGKSYLAKRPTDFISPDKQIDASTGLLRDTTWYIKNFEHNPFWDSVHPLLLSMCRTPGFNVYSDPSLPRFLMMESGGNHNIFPMTAENCDPNGEIVRDGDDAVRKPFFETLVKFFRYLADVFRLLLNRGQEA